MLNKYLLLSSLAMITLTNCKKPKACVQPSASVLKLGQPVTFSDCSENSEYYTYDFGDGTMPSEENSPVHAYEKPGSYTVTVDVENKKKRKEDQATTSVSVEDYSAGDISGTWTLYKTSGNAGSPTSPNQKYVFTADSVRIYDNGAQPYMVGHEMWRKTGPGEIAIGTAIYNVVKVYENELYLKEDLAFGYYYTTYQFKR